MYSFVFVASPTRWLIVVCIITILPYISSPQQTKNRPQKLNPPNLSVFLFLSVPLANSRGVASSKRNSKFSLVFKN